MEIKRFDSKTEAAAAAGEALNQLLLDSKNSPVLLALSAGSSFEILDYISPSALGDNLTATMLDERFSPTPDDNNFVQLQKLDFYALALEKEVNFIGTLPRKGELRADMAARFQISLETWKKNHPDGKIFATFGMGADGHTAGIFPYPEDLQFFSQNFKNSEWVISYSPAGKTPYPNRVTSTFSFFKLVDEAIMFVCGENKRPAFEKLIKGSEQAHALPSVGIFNTKHFQIFTDIT